MASARPLIGRPARIQRAVLETLPEIADRCVEWRPARTPNGTIAAACRPTWAGAPRELRFYFDPNDGALLAACLTGNSGRFAIVEPDGGGWISPTVAIHASRN
jgi:hypothetical protein